MRPSLSNLLEELAQLASCFSDEEVRKLRRALDLASPAGAGLAAEVQDAFRRAAGSLPLVASAIESCPSLQSHQRIGQRERGPETLVDKLCHSDELGIEFSMPTRAVLGRAFVLAKLNFLKALEYILEGAGKEAEAGVAILKALVGDTIFSKLAEELLSAVTSNQCNAMEVRRAAARKLIVMWDERLTQPVGRFPPVLLSAWRARLRVRAIFGTLIGVSEVFSLIQAECEEGFVNYFARDHVTADEREAFREFLFALSYEELEQVRKHMDEHKLTTISPAEVQSMIKTRSYPLLSGEPTPEEMYNSYCRRRLRADYRSLAGIQGPRKTAEGYIMEALMKEEAEQAREPKAEE